MSCIVSFHSLVTFKNFQNQIKNNPTLKNIKYLNKF